MSFTAETRERVRPAVPLASMVDIMFLMLIFVLTVSVFREQERQLDVSLPGAGSSQPARSQTQIIVTLSGDNRIFIGNHEYTMESLRQTLGKLAAEFPNETVVIRGDRASSFGLAVRILDTAYAAGLKNVFIATTKLESEL